VPREDDRLNFMALVYLLAKQLIAVGVVPDLSFTSIARDSEKKIKFMRKSDRGTEHFQEQLLALFMYIMTGSDKQEEQLKLIKEVPELPADLKEALSAKINSPDTADQLRGFLRKYIEEEVPISQSINGTDRPMLLSFNLTQLILSHPVSRLVEYELDLNECVF